MTKLIPKPSMLALLMLLTLLCCWLPVGAYDFWEDFLTYNVNSDGTSVAVSSRNTYSDDVAISMLNSLAGPVKVRLANGEIDYRYEGSDSVIEVLDDAKMPKTFGLDEKGIAIPARATMLPPQQSTCLQVNRRATTYDARDYTGTLTCRALREDGSSVDEQRTYTVTVSVGSYDDLSNVAITFKNMYGFANITGYLDYSTRTFYMPSGQNVSTSSSLLLYAMNEDFIYYSGNYYLTGRLSSDGTTIVMDGHSGFNGFYLTGTSSYMYMNNVITLPLPIEIEGVYPPVISPSGGQFVGTKDVTISSATNEAVIKYQFDDDSEWQTLENGGTITIDKTCTITAYALLGEENSATRSESYISIIPNEFALSDDELAALNFQTNYALINGSPQLVERSYTTSISYSDLTREKLYIRNFWGVGTLTATVDWTSQGEGVVSIQAQDYLVYNRYASSQRYDWYVIAPTGINDGVVRDFYDFAYNDDYLVLGTINKDELWINDHCIMAVCAFVGQTTTEHGPVYGNSVLRTKISTSHAAHRFRDNNGSERSHRIAIEQDLSHQLDESSPRVYTKVVGLNGFSGETTICTYLPENSSELVDGYDNLARIDVVESASARWFYPAYPNDVTNSTWYDFYYQDSDGNDIMGAYSNSNKEFSWNNGLLSSSIGWLEQTTENRIVVDDDVEAYGVGEGALSPAIRQYGIHLSSSADTWNDNTAAKGFVLSGTYFSIANRSGTIYYAISNGDWQTTGLNLNSGEAFSLNINVQFPENESVHALRLAACDNEGLYSKFHEANFYDVKFFEATGVYNRNYTSRPVELPDLSLTNVSTNEILTEGTHYKAKYFNNRNAGTASIEITGVYPYSTGNNTIQFEISPAVMDADVAFDQDSYSYSKDGTSITPNLQVIDKIFGALDPEDYTLEFSNNTYPGEASVTVTAQRNFIGETTANFEISRADILADDFTYEANRQVLYDGKPKQVTVHSNYSNFPEATVIYRDKNSNEEATSIEPGEYDVDIVFAQNRCFNSARFNNVTSVVCKLLNEDDWEVLKQFHAATNGNGWNNTWDMSDRKNASSLYGLMFDDDRVVAINENNQQLSGAFPAMLLLLNQLQSLDLSHNNLSGNPCESIDDYPNVGSGNLKYLNVSDNNLNGNVGGFANALTGLETLIADNNHFNEVNPPIPLSITTLDITNQTLSDVLSLTVNDLIGADLIDRLPTIVTYNHENQSFTLQQLTLSEQSTSGGFSMTYNENWIFSSDYKSDNGQILNLKSRYCTMPISFNFQIGDSNFDGDVSVLDLQSTINKIFGEFQKPFNWTAANVIVDERLNVQDVVGEVNLLLANNSGAGMRRRAPQAGDDGHGTPAGAANLYWRDGVLYLASDKPVAALDVILAGDVKWDIARYGLSVGTRGSHTVAYSLTGGSIPAGVTPVATALEAVAPAVTAAMLSDTAALEIPVSLTDPDITGVNDIMPDGVTVVTPAPGTIALAAPVAIENAEWTVVAVDGRVVAAASGSLSAGLTELATGLDTGVYAVVVKAAATPVAVTKILISNQ